MSEKEKTPQAPKVPESEELVDYMAPLLGRDERKTIFVAVNGETLQIQRGVPVKIKRKFYNALRNADAQTYAAYQYMGRMQEQARGGKPATDM